jgi:two-component system chemotaxis sensor kinase CheA
VTALRQRLLDVFAVEYREHSEAIRRTVSSAADAGDGDGMAGLPEATRCAHSLKGAVRAVGLEAAERLAHDLESLFLKMQSGEAKLDENARDRICRTLDEIEDAVFASGAIKAPAPEAGAPAEPKDEPSPGETEPASAGDGETAAPAMPGSPQGDLVRVSADDLDSLLKSAGELHTDMMFQSIGAQEVRAVSLRMAALEGQMVRSLKQMERGALPTSGRPAHGLGGEQLASQVRFLSKELRAVAQRQALGAKTLRHHLEELERRVMAARMMPAESVFGGFRKMVRDLAGGEGKDVTVVVEGLDCEADRLVLQRIKDPVMHILRNTVSHGIEPPDERRARGKDPQATVSLRVSSEHDRLRIVVEDDGRGLDFRRIAQKAVEQNRLSRDEAATASEQTLSRLLFEPGFSTAESVTTISGRGVGLSVAHEAVADLQGTIEISSKPRGGTNVDVVLPLNILARRLLLVSLKDQAFAFPCESVAKVMRVAVSAVATLEGRPVVRHRDATLPLTSIGELLDLGHTIVTTGTGTVSIVVVRNGPAQIAVAVEDFLGVNDFVVRHFETGSRRRKRWMGLITREDGTPCLVLDTDTLLNGNLARQPASLMFKAAQRDADRSKVILVVDDSITTRTLEKSILEAHGYRVRLSVNGRDALAQLRSELPDAVVSDIEMPHMNGFELLDAMKEDKRLANVPVILVTSRGDARDRERGLKLGADAYVVKQKFDQDDLLRTIRQVA